MRRNNSQILVRNEVWQDLQFIIKMSLLDLVLAYSVYFLFSIFIDGYESNPNKSFFEPIGVPATFLLLTVFFPFTETLFVQAIPILLLKRASLSNWSIIIIDALLFSSLHIPQYNLYIEVLLVIPGAIILAWSFIKYSQDSWFKAFGITMAIHALSNFIITTHTFIEEYIL